MFFPHNFLITGISILFIALGVVSIVAFIDGLCWREFRFAFESEESWYEPTWGP